jgi:hypothetical protein
VRWWPAKRSKNERHEDIAVSLWDVVIALAFLTAGLLVCGAGLYFEDNAVLGIGMLVAFFGAYVLLQSLFALLIDATIGYRGIGLGLIVIIVGFFLMQGYAWLVEAH